MVSVGSRNLLSEKPTGSIFVLEIKLWTMSKFSVDDEYAIYCGDANEFLDALPRKAVFDLIVTSPPYNLGKSYEKREAFTAYARAQKRVITKMIARLKPTGSLCWQVGNFTSNGNGSRGSVYPLDYLFHPFFSESGLQLRNRIV